MDPLKGGATSAPSAVYIYLSISFCTRRSISGITSHVTWSKWLLFTLYGEIQQQQGEQEFGDYEAILQFAEDVFLQHRKTAISMKKLYEIYKWYNDDTRYRHKLPSFQKIQGTVISLSCNLKKISFKNFVLPAEQPVSRRCHCQWFHWITDTSSARHTQETHPVRTAIDQRGEQTINKDAKPSGV